MGLVGRLKQRLVGRNVIALLADTDQGLFLVSPEDQGVGRELARDGSYGVEEIERVLGLVKEGSEVLIVGGHVGSIAIPVSRRVRSVTVIEANPVTFKLLSANILLNRAENVAAIQVAASNKRETIDFVLSRANSGGAKRKPRMASYQYFYDHPAIVPVQGDRLDTLLTGKRFELIFMDIEGSEYFALSGMQTLLQNANHLIVEFIPHHLRNVSAVTPQEFIGAISPHFARLHIPSKRLTVGQHQFLNVLQDMYTRNESDDGILFSK
jgi:FkbM family methyltransferase